VSYLLDTDTCIAIFEDRPARARRRLAEARRAGAVIAVPTVALFELRFGVARSAPARKPANEARLREFLSGPVEVLPFEAGDARSPARSARRCERPGRRSAPTTC
jgi:tRNA(fMet)-specific endonuclease VapC